MVHLRVIASLLLFTLFARLHGQGLEVGMGKAEMKVFFPGVGMYGYSLPKQKVKCPGTRLFARSMLIKDTGSKEILLFINCELAFISKAVKDTVLARLTEKHPNDGFTEQNVMITATHTHSAPGGFFLDALFNIPTGGFHYGVFHGVVNGIVASVEQARNSTAPASMYYGQSLFPDDDDVAYNRSLEAYNVDQPPGQKKNHQQTNQALDRMMRGIKVVDTAGVPIGFVNWFGVHATCVSNKNSAISFDNKGYASEYFENGLNAAPIAIFAQEKAGDVSPNYHGSSKARIRSEARKRRKDKGYGRAVDNGRIQAARGFELFLDADRLLSPKIDHALMYVQMNDAPIDADLAPPDAHTTEACYGKRFGYGTPIDGRGGKTMVDLAFFLLGNRCRDGQCETVKKMQNPKEVFVNAHRGTLLNRMPEDLPCYVNYGDLRRQQKNNSLSKNPWVQELVPIQLFIIGDVCLAGVPGELTTHAGDKLASVILSALSQRGIKDVVLSTYANAYVGYITTPLGYQCQTYEGGHTIFGPWELPAFQTAFRRLAEFMTDPSRTGHEPQPALRPVFDVSELDGRVFPGSRTAVEGSMNECGPAKMKQRYK